jgi:diguanylate cyclase (GGDEF)-like protein/putative nucleotidyltransferase with HDIG domain/PAS domain S-box-containing protein
VADVDLFKAFNDTHGHSDGDHELARIGAVLRASARAGDVVARVGGDEFAMILPSTDLQGAVDRAERLASELRGDHELSVTLSLGLAALNRAEPTTTRLFRDADAALYDAKALGRDRVRARRMGDTELDATEFCSPHGQEDRRLLTERLRAVQREMTESVSILQALQEATPMGLGFVDRDLRFLHLNPTLASIRRSESSELVGRNARDLFPEHASELEALLRHVIDDASPATTDLLEELVPPGGTTRREWNTYLFPVRVSGAVVGAGAVMVDVTSAKRAADVQRSTIKQIVDALGATSEMRDPYTAGHQNHVATIAIAIARELGCSEVQANEIGLAAKIHDIGKVGIPSEILTKPGKLSDAEMGLVRTHARLGYDLLHGVRFPERVAEIVLHHHERLDASGYPDHLRGDEVSLGARIVAVADVVEAVAARRPYRAALGVEAAFQALEEGRGTLYDPRVVDACIHLVREGRISLSRTAHDGTETSRRPDDHSSLSLVGAARRRSVNRHLAN